MYAAAAAEAEGFFVVALAVELEGPARGVESWSSSSFPFFPPFAAPPVDALPFPFAFGAGDLFSAAPPPGAASAPPADCLLVVALERTGDALRFFAGGGFL